MNNLQKIRESKGLPKEELARRVGTSRNQIYRYENGQQLTEVMIQKICKALEVKADYLLGLIDDEENKK
jgi:transcriptional regulator with XRE-family HTH domain